jgi:hypothetical protein
VPGVPGLWRGPSLLRGHSFALAVDTATVGGSRSELIEDRSHPRAEET